MCCASGMAQEANRKSSQRFDSESPWGWHLCRWKIKNGQSSVAAKSSGKEYAARQGWGIFGLGFYKDVPPTALEIKTKEVKSILPQKFED